MSISTRPRTRAAVWPLVATAARLGLAAVWLAAGLSKVGDLAGSGRAVAAYDLVPYPVAVAVGAAQPFVEVVLGLLLLAGVAVRLCAGISAALLAVFVAGIVSAWARGLRIDCGCFGTGGELGAGQDPAYGWDLLRDAGFLALAVLLLWRPRTRWSLDARLRGETP